MTTTLNNQSILRNNNEAGGIMLPDFKLCYSYSNCIGTHIICVTGDKIRHTNQQNRMESSPMLTRSVNLQLQDGGVEECVLIFSCKNTKIKTIC